MKKIITTFFFAATMIAVFALAASAQNASKFDEYGAVNTEDEMARLDNFTISLQNIPGATGYIIVYGGRKSRVGDAKAVIKRTLNYLTKMRGMDAARIKAIDGGLKELPSRELWIVPEGAPPPKPSPTIFPKKKIGPKKKP